MRVKSLLRGLPQRRIAIGTAVLESNTKIKEDAFLFEVGLYRVLTLISDFKQNKLSIAKSIGSRFIQRPKDTQSYIQKLPNNLNMSTNATLLAIVNKFLNFRIEDESQTL